MDSQNLQSVHKGYPYDDYWIEYQQLGGKKNRTEYDNELEIFIKHTLDIFVNGDPSVHKTRQEAWNVVGKLIGYKELDLVFDSVDNVTAYT